MTNRITNKFSALSDPHRFTIVDSLLKNGDMAAGDLHALSDLSAPAMSRHLRVLLDADLVTRRVDAQRRIYSVNPRGMDEIREWVERAHRFWSGSLDRLEKELEKHKEANK